MSSLLSLARSSQTRAVLMNSSQLASYDYFKSALIKLQGQGGSDGPVLQFAASFGAGTVATSELWEDSAGSFRERLGLRCLPGNGLGLVTVRDGVQGA